jgi:hypothetical protein
MTIPPAVESALAAATNTAPKKYLRNLLSRRLEQIEDRLYANAAVNGYGDITLGKYWHNEPMKNHHGLCGMH